MLASRVYDHVISVVLRMYDLLMSSSIGFDGDVNFRSCKCSMFVDKKWSELLRCSKLYRLETVGFSCFRLFDVCVFENL